MEKIVVFGGSFNPPTKAHYIVAEKAMNMVEGDKLYFLPVGDSYVKDELADANHRVNMLKALCNHVEDRKYFVDLTEVNSIKGLSTYETLSIMKEKNQNAELYFLIGADNLLHIADWYKSEKLLEEFKIIVMKREEYDISEIIKNREVLFNNKGNILTIDIKDSINVSSTLVREMISKNSNETTNYIFEEVKVYIEKHNLYKP